MFPVQRVVIIVASRAAAILFFPTYFFLEGGGGGCRKILSIFGEKNKNCKNEKKKSSVAPFLVTRPLHRKHNFFLVWPYVDNILLRIHNDHPLPVQVSICCHFFHCWSSFIMWPPQRSAPKKEQIIASKPTGAPTGALTY